MQIFPYFSSWKPVWLIVIFFVCSFGRLNAQELNVSGKVTDADGMPLPGVNVYQKGRPTSGTISGTDFQNQYANW
ncbi:MAG: hypothetical protein ACK4GN_14715 [Runella sp.]